MTMQVGMVGTDGILIAGDTRWMKEPRLEDRFWLGGRTAFNSSKIRINHQRGMAISCARDMILALQVTAGIFSELSDEQIASPVAAIETIAAGVLSEKSKDKLPAHCLIAFAKPSPKLFLFQFGTDNGE